LQNNATFFAEQLALYNSAHQGALTLTAQTGNNVASLSLKETTPNWASIIALAASQNPASLLPPGTDPTVLKGYIAQRQQILAAYASYSSAIGSISWNTGATTSVYMVKPLSRGTIKINSTSIFDNPLVDFGAFTDPTDIEIVLALVRKNRQIMAQPYMTELGPLELTPGTSLTTDDQIKAAIRAQIDPSIAHECCTLPMMPLDHGGVVDPNRLVYGLNGLRVADVSAWPFTPGSAPSATVYAAAEKVSSNL
jgi:choline dehydrogenase